MVKAALIILPRSDGKAKVQNPKTEIWEPNRPDDSLISPNGAVEKYFRRVEPGSERDLDWRRKTGGLLASLLKFPTDKTSSFILREWPDNYQLFEYVSNSTRVDAYLYGHPGGPKRRFRSPGEFIHHAMWLAVGKSRKRRHCTCTCCAHGADHEKAEYLAKYYEKNVDSDVHDPLRMDPNAARKAAGGSVSSSSSHKRTLSVGSQAAPKRTKSVPPSAVAQPPPKAASAKAVKPAVNPSPQSPRPVQSYERELDSQGVFIYRLGELVWFARGESWGLGMIYKRESQQTGRVYTIQPLSHRYSYPTPAINRQEKIRPWHAMSAPAPTNEFLADPRWVYSNIDWQGVLDGRYGRGEAEVDASIFAAKAVDESYTLTDPIQPSQQGLVRGADVSYAGVFLGAERIWIGDPVRLTLPNRNVCIMIAHQIKETREPNQQYPNGFASKVLFVGDIYEWVLTSKDNISKLPLNPQLHPRLKRDMDWRNKLTSQRKGEVGYWNKIGPATIPASDIRGRWYESSTLLPLLQDQASFQDSIRQGTVTDTTFLLNGHGDSTGVSGKMGSKTQTRESAYGEAIPNNVRIIQDSRSYQQLPKLESDAKGDAASIGVKGE